MSTFKYWESELEGLKDGSARLEHDYQTQSEAVKLDPAVATIRRERWCLEPRASGQGSMKP